MKVRLTLNLDTIEVMEEDSREKRRGREAGDEEPTRPEASHSEEIHTSLSPTAQGGAPQNLAQGKQGTPPGAESATESSGERFLPAELVEVVQKGFRRYYTFRLGTGFAVKLVV